MAIRLAAVLIGSVIGAGFASGQEVLQFFLVYQRGGLLGMVLALLVLALGSKSILSFCHKANCQTYSDMFLRLCPSYARPLETLVTFFLFAGTAVMLAGCEELLRGGRILTALLLILGLQRGAQGFLRLSPFLVFVLVALMLGMMTKSIDQTGIKLPDEVLLQGVPSGVLYASYNLGFALPIFASLGYALPSPKDALLASILATFVLGLLICMQFLALYASSYSASVLPLLSLATNLGTFTRNSYGVALGLAMYTTALANGLTLATQVQSHTKLSWSTNVIIVTFISLLLSYVGFSTLIRMAYPLFGGVSLYLLHRVDVYERSHT